MRKLYCIILLHFLIQTSSIGQHINRAEELRINHLLEEGRKSFAAGNHSAALQTAIQAENRAEKIEHVQLSWEARNLQGEVFLTTGNYEKTVNLFMDMAIHAEKRENYSVSANAYFSLANAFSALSAFDIATSYYEKAYQQFEMIDYELGMIEIALASGYNLIRAHDLVNSEKQFQNLLTLAVKDSIRYFEYEAYDALIEIYDAKNEPKFGSKYAKAYYDLIKDEGDSKKISLLAYHLSVFYEQMKLQDKADEFLKIALSKNPQNKKAYESKSIGFNMPKKLSESEVNKANLLAKKLESEALAMIKSKDQEFVFAEENAIKNVQKQEKMQLSELAHNFLLGDKEMDHSALQTEYSHQDLLISHHEYETRERQAELARYKLESKLNQLAKEDEENKRKIAEEEKVILQQEVEIKNQQTLYYVTLLIAVAILIIILSIEYVRVRKLNKMLAKQQQTIHQSNIQLKASNEDIKKANIELQKAQDDLSAIFLKEKKIRIALEKALGELKQTQSSLIQAEKMSALGMLTAGIAHELKNPINFISNGVLLIEENADEVFKHLSTLEEENDTIAELKSDISELIKDTKFGTERIQEIVEGLRVYSRKDEAEFKKADVVQIMNSALLILKPKYKHKAEIVKKFDENIPNIDCFQGEINQAFINIIGNGVDALNKFGTITITINNLENKFVRVIIQDNGSGIPDDVKAKIFSPLFTTKTESEGTGLGLSITADIIKKHHGKLQLKTKMGVGTAFIITLPVDQTTTS
ncbi:ATP-binding protein [Reichenbachiella agarivorans]|uniref:histidine kinase n=1 Tax=Reichenbachiella agarivorans TaxID=2979464 RepID=A0ABY6CVX9_9BACT|nr:ATP-binding protein [Reichenbachiella agarivorans]UXP32415.1 ATP-binding protein [Reichenbachiella agarivorans]